MTLDELEKRIARAADPKDLLGDDDSAAGLDIDIDNGFRELIAACRPDRHPGRELRAAGVERTLRSMADHARRPPLILVSPQREYALVRRLGTGDLSDVRLGESDGERFVVKVSRIPEGADLLDIEREIAADLFDRAADAHYQRFFPALVESFVLSDAFPKRINVFRYDPGFLSLEQVHDRRHALDGRHLGWIFKRLLTALGFAHQTGRIHGAIAPPHVLLHAGDHGLRLVGWGHSMVAGQPLRTGPAKYRDWYPLEARRREPTGPGTDLFLAAKCMIYLAGGDPIANRIPDALPREMGAFFRSCLLDGLRMRPNDAWRLHDEFDELLGDLYGPPQFHPLTL